MQEHQPFVKKKNVNSWSLYIHQQIVSCAGDGMIHFTDLDRESTFGQFQFDCHAGTTYEVHYTIWSWFLKKKECNPMSLHIQPVCVFLCRFISKRMINM